jgi:hypothetical protein
MTHLQKQSNPRGRLHHHNTAQQKDITISYIKRKTQDHGDVEQRSMMGRCLTCTIEVHDELEF